MNSINIKSQTFPPDEDIVKFSEEMQNPRTAIINVRR